MTEKRPWQRPEFTEPPAPDIDFVNASDGEVRTYCLKQSRAFLARAETPNSSISSGRQLEIATQYATIAEAFRADLGE